MSMLPLRRPTAALPLALVLLCCLAIGVVLPLTSEQLLQPLVLAALAGVTLPVLLQRRVGPALLISLAAGLGTNLLQTHRLQFGAVPVNFDDLVYLFVAVMLVLAWGQRSFSRATPAGTWDMAVFGLATVVALAYGILVGNGLYAVLQDLRIPLNMAIGLGCARLLLVDRKSALVLVKLLILTGVLAASQQIWTALASSFSALDFQEIRDPSLPLAMSAGGLVLVVALKARMPDVLRTRNAALLIVVLVSAILASLVRTLWLSTIATLLLLILFDSTHRSLRTVAAGAIVCVVTFLGASELGLPIAKLAYFVRERTAIFGGEDFSAQSRLVELTVIKTVVGPRTWLGNGLGAKLPVFDPVVRATQGVFETTNAHNSFAWYFLKGGLVYLLALAIAGWGAIGRCWSTFRSSDPFIRTLALANGLYLVQLALASLGGGSLHLPYQAAIVGMSAGLSLWLASEHRRTCSP